MSSTKLTFIQDKKVGCVPSAKHPESCDCVKCSTFTFLAQKKSYIIPPVKPLTECGGNTGQPFFLSDDGNLYYSYEDYLSSCKK